MILNQLPLIYWLSLPNSLILCRFLQWYDNQMQALREGNSPGQINGPFIDMPIVRKAAKRADTSETLRASASRLLKRCRCILSKIFQATHYKHNWWASLQSASQIINKNPLGLLNEIIGKTDFFKYDLFPATKKNWFSTN